MWRCFSVALLGAVPLSLSGAHRAAVFGLQIEPAGAASFGAELVACSGPLDESLQLFVGDRGGVAEAVEEVGSMLLEIPSGEVIRRVLMPGERRASLRLRPVVDLDGDGWSDVCELLGATTGAPCERSAIVRSGRTGAALWSANRFAERGEQSGRESLFRGWLRTGLEDLTFLPDLDEDGAHELAVLGESLAVWSGASTEALWVRDAKDLPQGMNKTLTRLSAASGRDRLAVAGLGGALHIFDVETGEELQRYTALEADERYRSHAIRLSEAVFNTADFDGDGDPDDVVCFEYRGAEVGRDGEVSAFSSATGKRLWSFQVEGEQGFGSAAAAVGDMNGDGFCDYAVGATAAGTVTLLSGTGGGVLWTRKRAPGFGAKLVALPDLDGDGVLEIAMGLPPVPKSKGGAVVILKGSNGRQWLRIEPPE